MSRLFKADLYRIFRGVAIYVAIAIMVIAGTLSVWKKSPGYIGAVVSVDDKAVLMVDPEQNDAISESSGLVERILGANYNLYYAMIPLVFAVLIADFSQHTLKNTLTSAVSRRKYFAYKLLLCLGGSALLLVFNNLFIYLFNAVVNGKAYTGSFLRIVKVTALQLPVILAMATFLAMLGFLVRNAVAFNGISIPFQVVLQIVIAAVYHFTKVEFLVHFTEKYEWSLMLTWLAYLPKSSYCLRCLVVCLAEIAVFSWVSMLAFKRAEIR